MTEIIYLVVKVEINYDDKKNRKEAIKKAKYCVLSTRVFGSIGCDAKSAKLVTPQPKNQ
jgi:hypothetical protein